MKILLVDDDEGVVQALVAILHTQPGHDVRGATTAGQALQTAMALGGIDLLVTDVVMEPMDGFTLRDQMASRYPAARVIFISGYDLSDYGAQTAGHQVLSKPIDAAELLAAIAREFPSEAPEEAVVEEPAAEEAPVAAAEEPAPEPMAVEETPAEPEPEPEPIAPVVAAAPVAVPVPVAVPRVAVAAVAPKAVPVATPVAVPKVAVAAQPKVAVAAAATVSAVKAVAQPKAVAAPVAVPKAVAAPVAVPKVSVAPMAVPKAVAAPVAVPKAVAQPTAVPKAVATVPKATAAPAVAAASPATPVATPRAAVPVAAKPTAVAKPVAAVPKPMAAPKAVAAPHAPSAPSLPVHVGPLPDDELVGQTIGSYEIKRVLGKSRLGTVYAAMQTSVNRLVSLKILDPSQASDESARTRFLGDARAKAHVQHPAILAVYEAGEANGHVFYTHEYVDGRNLAEIHAVGERFDEPTALKVLKATAEGLNYLHANQIPHSAPDGSHVYLGADGQPRLANLATSAAEEQAPLDQEIQAVGRLILSLLPAIQTVSPPFRGLLSRMVQSGPQNANSWGSLVQGLKALEPKVIPAEAAKISAQDRAANAAVESARKSHKRSLYVNIGSTLSLVIIAGLAVWHFFLSTNERTVDEQVKIPAGPFIFGSGQTVDLPDFWIDKYEVSIGEYAQFVQLLEDRPTSEYDHPKQPKLKTSTMHKPKDWAIYYGRAKQGMAIHSVPSDLNMPAITIDWWDAYAYAKWKGRELPTEQEWEKAARGSQGFVYPWGNEFDPKKVNANADFNANNPAAPGKVDGFNYWGPVDKQPDKSPYGVIGMAGNVAEWTGTWDKGQQFPVIKGGSFMSSDVRLDKRTDKEPPQTAQENLGFRTVTHTAPAK